MKICFASDYFPDYHRTWGGAEQACARLASLLQKNGHDVSIITTIPDQPIVEKFKHVPMNVIENYLPLSMSRPLRFFKSTIFPYDPISHARSKKLFRKSPPDILHLHNFSSLSFSLLLTARKHHIRTVMSAYDFWFICPEGFCWLLSDYLSYSGEPCKRYHGLHCKQCLSKYVPLTLLQKTLLSCLLPFRKKIFDYFLKQLDGFIVLSEDNARIPRQYGVADYKIHVVHIPLTIEAADLQPSRIEKNSILFTGWTHPRKGLKVVVEAMASIVRSFPDARLYAIGGSYDKSYEGVLAGIIKKNKLENNVHLLGKKPYSVVQQYIRKAHVLVIPEQWETIAPNALTEGIVFGKPVVAGNIGGILDVIKDGENGLLAKYNDPKDYARKITMLFEDETLSKRLAKKARETGLSLFAEERVYKELMTAYHS